MIQTQILEQKEKGFPEMKIRLFFADDCGTPVRHGFIQTLRKMRPEAKISLKHTPQKSALRYVN